MLVWGRLQKYRSLTLLSSFFAESAIFRHIIFLSLACVTIFLSGYYFGTFDQSIHIPFLKKEMFPFLYPKDPFFDLRHTHYSYFWYFFQPFYKFGILEISLFVTHLAITYLTFWAVWRLSKTLFRDELASFLIVISFSFPHLGFAAFPVFEFSLLNRTFVLPFLLLSIDLYLQKRYLASFLLLGAMNNIHALSVNFVMFMFCVDLMFRFFQKRWKMEQKFQIIAGFICFFLTSLPVLIWKFGKSPLDMTIRPEWFSIITRSFMYTVFYPLSTSPFVLFLTVCGVSAFLLYFVMTKYQSLSEYAESITHFMYAAIFLIGLEVIVSEWLPVTFLVQFQIIRVGIFALIFAYMFFVFSLVRKYKAREISSSQFLVQFSSVFLSITALVPFVVAFMMRFLPKKDRLFAGVATILTSFIVFSLLAWQLNIWRPGIHVFAEKSDWVNVQLWAKDNTSKDALFITPPEKWWFFEPDWRVFSERSTVATLSEVLEFAFTPEYTNYWKSRFADVAPGALEKFHGDVIESKRLTEAAYVGLSDADFLKIASKYKASYIVVEKPRVLPLPLVYQNKSFSVYAATLFAHSAPSIQSKLTTGKISHTIQ